MIEPPQISFIDKRFKPVGICKKGRYFNVATRGLNDHGGCGAFPDGKRLFKVSYATTESTQNTNAFN
jgi:hypothetical protein